jgi:hypothetical protein
MYGTPSAPYGLAASGDADYIGEAGRIPWITRQASQADRSVTCTKLGNISAQAE